MLALIALGVVFALNMLSVKMFGEAEFWFAAIKVDRHRPIHDRGYLGHCRGRPGWQLYGRISQHHSDMAGSSPLAWRRSLRSRLGVIFAFGGTEMVGVAAGETKDASKILPKAINSMILRIFVFYVGSIISDGARAAIHCLFDQ